MEAFPDFHDPFILDQSLSFLNPTTAAAATATAAFHDQQYLLQPHHHTALIEVTGHTNQASIANNSQFSSDSSSVVVYDHNFERKIMPTANSSSFNYSQSNDDNKPKKSCRRLRKAKKSMNENDEEGKGKGKKKMKEEGQIGYIHVRARRGEATDSHSLAERVRREKISEKMKALQAIVPGCDKITGKALMLDEVINYVQSLQKEIEILSLKLASVNSLYESGEDIDAFMLKPHQDLTTDQQHLLSFQEQYHVSNMFSENNGDISWDVEELRQKLDDPFAVINNFDSFC